MKTASTTGDPFKHPLTIGLAAGLGGVILLALVVISAVVVVRRRKLHKSGGNGDSTELQSPERSACLSGSGNGDLYVNVSGISAQHHRHEEDNSTGLVSTGLPDPLLRPCITAHTQKIHDAYEEVDLPPLTGPSIDVNGQYNLAGKFEHPKTSEEFKDCKLYSNHKIAENKGKQSAGEKISTDQTAQNEAVYNVLSKPNMNPCPAAHDYQDDYNTLYAVNWKPTNESKSVIQHGMTGNGNHDDNGYVYGTYSTIQSDTKQEGSIGVITELRCIAKQQQSGCEYDTLKLGTF
ncbi:uncharacterized protein LOC135462447 [Liolophura sinensis]|uniref:uncharacterized protein LOC135462447 n=1 Tax=Liolophura sinensis TaxID=3198878 RepID=UPI003158A3BE